MANIRRHALPETPRARITPTSVEVRLRCEVPVLPNTRRHWRAALAAKNRQQGLVRQALNLAAQHDLAHPLERPWTVLLIRVSWAKAKDEDNLPGALKHVRDTVARWAHGLEEQIPRLNDGKPVLRRGRLQMTRPPAPDGPECGLVFRYGQLHAERDQQGLIIHVAHTG